MQFFFGQILAPMVGEKRGAIHCTQYFGVAVTIDHAKRILDLLARQIKATEEIFKARQTENVITEKSDAP